MPNNSSNITWKQIGVILMLLGFIFAGIGLINTKADKTDVEKQVASVESRSEKRISNVQTELKEDIKKVEIKLDKVYDLLLKMNKP